MPSDGCHKCNLKARDEVCIHRNSSLKLIWRLTGGTASAKNSARKRPPLVAVSLTDMPLAANRMLAARLFDGGRLESRW